MSLSCPRHSEESWIHCALCRASRTGMNAYMRARSAVHVECPSQTNTTDVTGHIDDVIEKESPMTSFNEAFSTMMNCLRTSSLKCEGYHHSSRPQDDYSHTRHLTHYHTHKFSPVTHGNQKEPTIASRCIKMTGLAPGTYTVSAVREDNNKTQHKKCKHSLKLEPGRTVNLTFDL